jgi:DNA-directed RNA polymerase subunit N
LIYNKILLQMIFPISCYTCGKIIEDKKELYDKLVLEQKNDNKKYNKCNNKNQEEIFKKIGIKRYCCKKFFLTNVSIFDFIKHY